MADAHPLLHLAPWGLAAAAVVGFATWLASLPRGDASLIDRTWSILIAAPTVIYLWLSAPASTRGVIAVVLTVAWALRLCIYVTRRNWGHGEDRRYREIRLRNEPNFALKSIYLVFALQAVLAWIVGMPTLAAVLGERPFGGLDGVGAALAAFGIVFEAIADAQMAHFKAQPSQQGRVMDRGLWRFTRHPNYFGECCVWWGFFLMALPCGGWWSVVSPLVMTGLLLKVSGVALLEKDIGERRPAYRDYIARTNAFLPGPPKRAAR
jgi:steroid 5-alpha reductase family enzyme